MQAVILAAGEGKRLRPHFGGPKPLVRLLGLALIERNILGLKECGIERFTIVIGHEGEKIRQHLGDGQRYGVHIGYVESPDWHLGNGHSAYAFGQAYDGKQPFLLLMSDHQFEVQALQRFVEQARTLPADELLLACDRRLNQVFDLDECTKVQSVGDLALRLGKELTQFDAVDCGLFAGGHALLEALGQAISQGQHTLTDAVNLLAARRKVRLHDIDGAWIDVDDLQSYRQAEKLFLQSLIPPKDGLISRHINRKFSLRITRLLANTRITPNQISLLSFLLSTASALSFAFLHPLLGGLLAQASSITDGVDGEIARLKFKKSPFGGLFDAVLDRYADAFILIGMGYAWYVHSGSMWALLVTAAALAGAPMSMIVKEKYQAITGKTYVPEEHDGISRYLPANRDGRMFLIMLGGIFNLVPATVLLLGAMTHIQTLIRLYRLHRIMK